MVLFDGLLGVVSGMSFESWAVIVELAGVTVAFLLEKLQVLKCGFLQAAVSDSCLCVTL